MASMAPMASTGVSASWASQKSNVTRIFNDSFRVSCEEVKALCPSDFNNLSEDVLCKPTVYALFATYLTEMYKIETGANKGKFLAIDTATNYLSSLINQASARFKNASAEATLFFTCLDINSTTESAKWLKGVKANMRRIVFKRLKEKGEEMDNSETPLYLLHVSAVAEAYAKANTGAAALWKFGVVSLWQIAGRSAEAAYINLDGLNWDHHFKCVFSEVPQSKTSKVKLVAFVAGHSRHECWFVHFADYLAMVQRSVYENGAGTFLIPELLKSSTPGTTLGGWIKALDKPAQGSVYAGLGVPELPDGANAGGIRPGACNSLAVAMPAELVVCTTGHDLTGYSSLYEYVDCDHAKCMPGAVVLGGWPALPWGQLGCGPVAPSLSELLANGIDVEKLDTCMDKVFQLDSASPPMLLKDGALRPAVHAAFASIIMYYNERLEAGEMQRVCITLKNVVFQDYYSGSTSIDPHCKLIEWGKIIRLKFITDNWHLTERTNDTALVQLSDRVNILGKSLADLRSLQSTVLKQQSELTEICRSLYLKVQPPNAVDDSQVDSEPGSAGSKRPAAASPSSPDHAEPKRNAFGSLVLMSTSSAPSQQTSLSGKSAQEVVLLWFERNCTLPLMSPSDKGRAQLVLRWFQAMANADENEMFKKKESDSGTVRRAVQHLNDLIVQWLAAAYKDAGLTIPRTLTFNTTTKKWQNLPASALEDKLKVLKKANAAEPDLDGFAQWRKDVDVENV